MVHRTLTNRKIISKEEEKDREKPKDLPGIILSSLFLQPDLCTGVWVYEGHTHCYRLLSLCLKDRHNLKPPATLGWNKHQKKREALFVETEPPAPAIDKGGPQRAAKAGALPKLAFQDATSLALQLINPRLDGARLSLEPYGGCGASAASSLCSQLLPPCCPHSRHRRRQTSPPVPQCSRMLLTEEKAKSLYLKVTSDIFLRERDSYFVIPQCHVCHLASLALCYFVD